MRIIAGIGKGRNLNSPIGATRPTSDRAREALFSTLESEFGELTNLNFLDLFTGSGAVAVEALSRGASLVHAVDNDDKAVRIARSNIALLNDISGVGSAHVFSSSVHRFLGTPTSHVKTQNQLKATGILYDIVFIDPPYECDNGEVEKILNELRPHVKESSVIAVERDSKVKPFHWPASYIESKERTYGHAVIYYGSPAQNG